MNYITYFKATLVMTLSRLAAYKFNFVVRTLTLLSFDLVLPIITLLVYLRTNGFFGWSFFDMMLFQGIFICFNAIDRLFFQRVDWSLSHDVRNGQFDRYLLYPVNTFVYIAFNNISVEHIANIVIGIALIIYASTQTTIVLSMQSIGLLLLIIMGALLFIVSTALLRFALIIRYVMIGRLGELFRTVKTYGQYPIDIYNGMLSSLFRYLIPLSLIGYYPSIILLGREAPTLKAVVVSMCLIFLITWWFWKRTLKFYTSAGG